jgi:hypothetical protein
MPKEEKIKFEAVTLFLARKMRDQYYGKDIFAKLTEYHVFEYHKPSQEMKDFRATGIAFFDGRIHVRYDRNGYDSRFTGLIPHVGAMELAHNALMVLLPGEYDEMNNLIHYADNLTLFHKRCEYMTRSIYQHRTKTQFLKGKPREKIVVEWYNLMNLVRDRKKINEIIASGNAPIGNNPYWRVRTESMGEEFLRMKAKGIMPGSVCSLFHSH